MCSQCRLHELDAELCGARLAAVVGALAPLLGSEQEGLRFAAGQGLQAIVSRCLSRELLAAAVSHAAAPRGKPPAATAAIGSIAALLDMRYHAAWPAVLPGAGFCYYMPHTVIHA